MIDYTLSVTSPPTQGARVRKAQQRLHSYLADAIDGVFGQATGRACRRAKFWLGYPTPEITATYGPNLDAFLSGESKPTPEMRKRAKTRQRKAAQTPLREKALAEARKYIGVHESPPGSNKVRFSDWFGIQGPWCAMFVTWCYVTGAKSRAFAKGSRYAYVPYIVADARAGRNGLSVTSSPKPGDIVCYDWNGDGTHDHTGLFQHWMPGGEGSEWMALEGNTGIGNDSNGGEVMERHRDRASGRPVFVRVGR